MLTNSGPRKETDTSRALYFIALVLPPPLDQQITAWKQYFNEHYGCRAALRSPPHITLYMPFEWKEKKEQELVLGLKEFAAIRHPVQVQLLNFGCFPPRVIYVQVTKTPALESLHLELQRFCRVRFNLTQATWRNEVFNPHVTLAFRDLKKVHFAEAWQAFQHREFAGSFHAHYLSLLKHNGKIWQEWQQLTLGQ